MRSTRVPHARRRRPSKGAPHVQGAGYVGALPALCSITRGSPPTHAPPPTGSNPTFEPHGNSPAAPCHPCALRPRERMATTHAHAHPRSHVLSTCRRHFRRPPPLPSRRPFRRAAAPRVPRRLTAKGRQTPPTRPHSLRHRATGYRYRRLRRYRALPSSLSCAIQQELHVH